MTRQSELRKEESVFKNYEEVIKASKSAANVMAQYFRQKKNNYELQNSKSQQIGSLDIARLPYMKTSDDLFARKRIKPQGKSHAVVVALDFSISMSKVIQETIIQGITLALFCKMIKIPFTIFSYTTFNSYNPSFKFSKSYEDKNYNKDNHKPRMCNLFNDSMTTKELIEVAYDLFYYFDYEGPCDYYQLTHYGRLGNTPSIQAFWHSFALCKNYQMNGIQNVTSLFITDGVCNMYFDDKRPYDIESIIDPLTNIPYTTNVINKSYTNRAFNRDFVSGFNKMFRAHRITSLGLFLSDSSAYAYGLIDDYSDAKLGDGREFKSSLDNDNILELKGVSEYNSYYVIDTKSLPAVKDITYDYFGDLDPDGASTRKINSVIKKNSNVTKNLKLIGKLICADIVKSYT